MRADQGTGGEADHSSATRLGANLKRIRAQRQLTQADVAARAGLTRAHYAALEAGKSSNGGPANPRLDTLIRLARALSSTPADVIAGTASDD